MPALQHRQSRRQPRRQLRRRPRQQPRRRPRWQPRRRPRTRLSPVRVVCSPSSTFDQLHNPRSASCPTCCSVKPPLSQHLLSSGSTAGSKVEAAFIGNMIRMEEHAEMGCRSTECGNAYNQRPRQLFGFPPRVTLRVTLLVGLLPTSDTLVTRTQERRELIPWPTLLASWGVLGSC